ncbi:MAG: hypothetical protein NC253_08725 [Ruminococcus sp.]|nr:hypothetical protein [Ruminococcus sp.]MCM1380907.1 hypothetical protein [Muribaculaceae bacterium]MCM1479050.1 hypothetical protein [Muribaculaceae bacterium]
MFPTLLKYEFKKLLKKKSVWIALVVSALCVPASLLMNILFYTMHIDTVRGSLSEGYYTVLKADIEQDKELDGRTVDGDFIAFLREAEKVSDVSYDENSLEYVKYIRAYENARTLIETVNGYDEKALADITAEDFYRSREEYMEDEWDYYCLSEGEKQFLRDLDGKTAKPFIYRYCYGYGVIMQAIAIGGMVVIFAAAICVSGIFTQDKRTKADRIVLSSRHGKTLAYGAKMLAAAGFTVSCFLLAAVSGIILVAAFFGMDGFNAPIQMAFIHLANDITCGEAMFILIGLGIAESVILSALCMIISQITSSGTPALVAMFVMLMVGNMLDVDPSRRLLASLWNILPSNAATYFNAFSVKLFDVGGHYFFPYQAAPIIYLAVSAALIVWGYWCYKRYQPK